MQCELVRTGGAALWVRSPERGRAGLYGNEINRLLENTIFVGCHLPLAHSLGP